MRISEIFSDARNVYRKDMLDTIGGGVFIAVEKNIVSGEVEVECDCEVIWTRTTGLQEIKLTVGSFYQTAGSTVTVLKSFNHSLRSVARKYSEYSVLVGGDFNLPSMDWDVYGFIAGDTDNQCFELLLNTLSENCLEQLN